MALHVGRGFFTENRKSLRALKSSKLPRIKDVLLQPGAASIWDKGGRVISFEGTYVTIFLGHEHSMPRYDYNQLLYRLDLEHGSLRELSTP